MFRNVFQILDVKLICWILVQVLTEAFLLTKTGLNMWLKYYARFPTGSKKRKSNNDDEHGHGQEKRRRSTYVVGEKDTKTFRNLWFFNHIKVFVIHPYLLNLSTLIWIYAPWSMRLTTFFGSGPLYSYWWFCMAVWYQLKWAVWKFMCLGITAVFAASRFSSWASMK